MTLGLVSVSAYSPRTYGGVNYSDIVASVNKRPIAKPTNEALSKTRSWRPKNRLLVVTGE